jgi:hypothetical protein
VVRRHFPAVFACALAVLASCAPDRSCKGERECAREAAVAHPIRRAAAWADTLKKPVDSRMGPASAALVEYLNLDNTAQGFPEKPRTAVLSEDFLADIRAAIRELPPSVKRLLTDEFAGIYFVEDLGGTGYTEYIRDSAERPVGAFIVLDASVLGRRRANSWATWKENTPFIADATHALNARIEDDADDNRRNAMQYILLHELGHVASVNAKAHPAWDRSPDETIRAQDFPYFALSWRPERGTGRYASTFDSAFELRSRIVYYLKPGLPAADMQSVYTQLGATNFPTLYAATNPADDFAEAFANYVHVVLLKKPFEIRITENGREALRYMACWEEARCKGKREFLERELGR